MSTAESPKRRGRLPKVKEAPPPPPPPPGAPLELFVATGQYGAKGSGRQEGQQLHGGEQGWQESAFVG